jgi:hypothetical protein
MLFEKHEMKCTMYWWMTLSVWYVSKISTSSIYKTYNTAPSCYTFMLPKLILKEFSTNILILYNSLNELWKLKLFQLVKCCIPILRSELGLNDLQH